MLNVVRVEFSKLRRWKLLRVLPLLSLVLPAITFSYFATHPDYLTDMGLYKQALFSFNIFLILPAILGVLASMLVYNEQRCDVLKQLWIIPVSKGGYLFAKWVVVLTVSLAFMMLAVAFTFAFGLAFGFLSWNGEMMAFVLYKGIEAAVLEAVAVIPILALAVSHKGYLLPCCTAIIYAFLGFIVAQTNPYLIPSACAVLCISRDLPNVVMPCAYQPFFAVLCFGGWAVASGIYAYHGLSEK